MKELVMFLEIAGLPATLSFTLRRFDAMAIAGAPLSIVMGSSSFAPVTDALGVATLSVTQGVGTYDASHPTIAISVAVADVADPNPARAVTGVASNEAATGAWSLPGGLSVDLRADRNGNGNGRAYTIGVACTDASGNVANATTGVFVPHDQR